MDEKLRESQIHAILKVLSPKREINGRTICRSVTPEAVEYLTKSFNEYIKAIVSSCEEALRDINENPNSYYKQHRYDLQVVKAAIEKLGKGDNIL